MKKFFITIGVIVGAFVAFILVMKSADKDRKEALEAVKRDAEKKGIIPNQKVMEYLVDKKHEEIVDKKTTEVIELWKKKFGGK